MSDDLFSDKPNARDVANRKWGNADIRRRYKEALKEYGPDDPENPFQTEYGRKQQPTAPPAVNVISASPEQIKSIEKERRRRERQVNKILAEVLAPEMFTMNIKREVLIAGVRAHIYNQKRRLLLEKLKRMEAAQKVALQEANARTP